MDLNSADNSRAEARKTLQALVDKIKENPQHTWTVDVMAAEVHLSKFHFSRTFSATMGTSPGRAVAMARYEKAKELLTTTTMDVAEISSAVGLSSVGTFCTRFRVLFGKSPTSVRYEAKGIRRIPFSWNKYANCPECGVGAGQPCINLRTVLRQVTSNPHRGRRKKYQARKVNSFEFKE